MYSQTRTVVPTVGLDETFPQCLKIRRSTLELTNYEEGDQRRCLSHAVSSLQARSEEQSKLSVEAEQCQMEAKERHKIAEERYRKTLRMAEEREEELRRQLAVVKATMEKPTGLLLTVSPQPFGHNLSAKKSTRHLFPRASGS
ncbi:hypothetical protein CR513_44336, partial [Mucuna pruriens]